MKCYAVAAAALAFAALAPAAHASFHEWLPDEAFSDSTGNIQFLEFFDLDDFEQFLTSTSLQSNANTYDFSTNLPSSSTSNKHFLVGTAGFAALPGAPAPDYVIAANFFSTSADSLFLQFTVQPPLTFTAGQLPTDGTHSLFFDGSSLTTGINSPTNFAGTTGSVSAVPEPGSLGILGLAVGGMLLRRRK
jgi:hypothetical protein